MVIETPRLRLLPSTIPLARAEIGDRAEFARMLGAGTGSVFYASQMHVFGLVI